MDRDKFIEAFVKIEWVENSKCFGLFPFQMHVINIDGSAELNSIAIANAKICYRIFMDKISSKVDKVYLAMDFPKAEDMKHDFVAVFSYDRSKEPRIGLIAIPYTDEGVTMSPITLGESELLTKIKYETLRFFNPYAMI